MKCGGCFLCMENKRLKSSAERNGKTTRKKTWQKPNFYLGQYNNLPGFKYIYSNIVKAFFGNFISQLPTYHVQNTEK